MGRIRRWHVATLVLLVVAVAVGLVLGLAAGRYIYPYRTVAPPPVPRGLTAPQPVPSGEQPNCQGETNGQHSLGSCLPAPPQTGVTATADIVSSRLGPDLSNNDPVYGATSWKVIAAHNAFSFFKVNESTGFIDSTAQQMASAARAQHLPVGGYDFLHICIVSPAAEAHVFAINFKAHVGTGPGTLRPVGDAEYPLGSLGCNGRAWLTSWIQAVHRELGRWPVIYTGAWWWNPHIGCWWPSHALAWISGYTGSLSGVPLPCGRSHIDLWQLSDHGYNGVTYADLSQWEDSAAEFRQAASTAPAKPAHVCFGAHWQHTAYCLHARRVAADLGKAKGRQFAYLSVTNANLARLAAVLLSTQKLIAVKKGRQAAEAAKAHALGQQLCALITPLGFKGCRP